MANFDALFQNTQSKLDLGSALLQSAQSGAMLGQSFRQQDAALLAVQEANRAERAAAFEMSVRAARAVGEAQDREFQRSQMVLNNELARSQLRLNQDEMAFRRDEFNARLPLEERRVAVGEGQLKVSERDLEMEREEVQRRQRIQNRILGGMGLPSGDGSIDTTLLGGDDGGSDQLVFEGEMTTFSHLDELRDPQDRGVGFTGKSTAGVPGVSINQSQFEAQFGKVPKESIERDFEVEIIGSDGTLIGTLPIVDRGPSDEVIAQKGGVLDVTAAGIVQLGGQLETEGGYIMGHSLKGPHKFVVRRKGAAPNATEAPAGELNPEEELNRLSREDREGASVRVANGTRPEDPNYNPDYIEDLPPRERIPFRRRAMQEQRELVEAESIVELESEVMETQKALLDAQIEESRRFNASFDIPIPDPALTKQRVDLSVKESQLFREKQKLKLHRSRIEANIEAATPKFTNMPFTAQKEVGQILSVNSRLARAKKIFDEEIKEHTQGRIQGVITKLKNVAIEETDWSELQSILIGVVPTMARGIFQEVGVLTDRDMARYRSVLPDITNSSTLNDALFMAIELMLADVAKKNVSSSSLGGTDIAALRELFISEFGPDIIGTAGLKTPEAIEEVESEQTARAAEQAKIEANNADPQKPSHGKGRYKKDPVTGEDVLFVWDAVTGQYRRAVK